MGPFDRPLLIFVGKGGVGKTTVAAAIALRSARAGRRTLLVTIDPAQRLEDALGVPVGHRVKAVRGKLHAMMLDPEKVLQDYLSELAPEQDLRRHPLYKYISNYLPGLNELIAIGQLLELRREKDFETIVLDTAPTGHALSFLTTPMKIRDLLQESTFIKWAARGYALYQQLSRAGRAITGLVGRREAVPEVPDIDMETLFANVGRDMQEIHELLQDPQRTALHIVTAAERLAVEETQDLHRYITKELSVAVASVIVNRVDPPLEGVTPGAWRRFVDDAAARRRVGEALAAGGHPGGVEDAMVEATQFHLARHEMNLRRLAELDRALPRVPKYVLPLQREDVYGFDRLEALDGQMTEHRSRSA